MAFGRGAAEAEQAAKDNRPKFEKTEFFKMEDGEEVIARPVHDGDEWYYVKVHQFVPTKDADPDWDDDKIENYPKRIGVVCRRDKAFEYGECYVCDHLHERAENDRSKNGRWYPAIRYYVPFVLREEVRGTQEMIDAGEIPAEIKVKGEMVSTIDRVVGVRDQMVEVEEKDKDGEPTGKVTTRPRVVVVNKGYENFFGPLTALYEVANEDGDCTVLDRDLRIKMKGEKKEQKFFFKQMRPTPDFDLRDPELRKIYDFIDIEKLMTDQASDDRYAYYLDDRVDRPVREGDDEEGKGKAKKGTRKSTTKAAPRAAQAKPSETAADSAGDGDDEDVSASLAAIKGRMTRSHGRKADPEPEGDGDDGADQGEREPVAAGVGGGRRGGGFTPVDED